ncbi:MAG: hypothetical protein CBE24_07500 [bacterium TMED264]|nr:MAG: hypothetical protein CBE24_07500 [bacterium TMED264]|tara:strand:- start:90 stop:362 length:273 start_codon:yes stop_codon:yes gene_type:complete
MKKRITGAITFLGGLGTILSMIYALLAGDLYNVENIFIASGLVILGVSAILYVYWTEFGGDQEISKVEKENKLLRSKIEQKKLKKKLAKD